MTPPAFGRPQARHVASPPPCLPSVRVNLARGMGVSRGPLGVLRPDLGRVSQARPSLGLGFAPGSVSLRSPSPGPRSHERPTCLAPDSHVRVAGRAGGMPRVAHASGYLSGPIPAAVCVLLITLVVWPLRAVARVIARDAWPLRAFVWLITWEAWPLRAVAGLSMRDAWHLLGVVGRVRHGVCKLLPGSLRGTAWPLRAFCMAPHVERHGFWLAYVSRGAVGSVSGM